MSEIDHEQFESELRNLKPAKPPGELLNRVLDELAQSPQPGQSPRGRDSVVWRWWGLLRWLVPVSAAGAALGMLFFEQRTHERNKLKTQRPDALSHAPLKADQVEIDRQLLADFDAVGRLPSGEPVRFRCHQWMDKIRMRDSASGLVIERTTPRMEIVPVNFETY